MFEMEVLESGCIKGGQVIVLSCRWWWEEYEESEDNGAIYVHLLKDSWEHSFQSTEFRSFNCEQLACSSSHPCRCEQSAYATVAWYDRISGQTSAWPPPGLFCHSSYTRSSLSPASTKSEQPTYQSLNPKQTKFQPLVSSLHDAKPGQAECQKNRP